MATPNDIVIHHTEFQMQSKNEKSSNNEAQRSSSGQASDKNSFSTVENEGNTNGENHLNNLFSNNSSSNISQDLTQKNNLSINSHSSALIKRQKRKSKVIKVFCIVALILIGSVASAVLVCMFMVDSKNVPVRSPFQFSVHEMNAKLMSELSTDKLRCSGNNKEICISFLDENQSGFVTLHKNGSVFRVIRKGTFEITLSATLNSSTSDLVCIQYTHTDRDVCSKNNIISAGVSLHVLDIVSLNAGDEFYVKIRHRHNLYISGFTKLMIKYYAF